MRRYYICPVIGDGTEENSFRPDVAGHGSGWGMIDLRPNSGRTDGIAIAYLDSDNIVSGPGIYLLTDNLNDKAKSIKQIFNSKAKLNLESVTLPELLAELLIHPQRTGFCKPLKLGLDGKYRIYLNGLIWGVPSPNYKHGTITDNFNRSDADAMGGPDGWTWNELYGDIDIVSNTAESQTGSGDWARAESDLSSDDMYSQIDITENLNGYSVAVKCRYNSGTYESYAAYSEMGSTTTQPSLAKHNDAASRTWLVQAGFEASPTPPYEIKLEVDGSSLKIYWDDVEKASTTDTDITGNLRTGMRIYGTGMNVDNFEAGELGAAGWAHDLNGVANASIGSINGVAKASIGSINGVS